MRVEPCPLGENGGMLPQENFHALRLLLVASGSPKMLDNKTTEYFFLNVYFKNSGREIPALLPLCMKS